MSRFAAFDHDFVIRVVCVAGCLAFVVAPARAATDAGVRSVRVEYDAPASCPDARAFEAQLRARSARIVVAPDAKTAVHVRIVARGERYDGDVALTDAGGSDTTRRVDGACTDVVAALSLIAAVALDPMASTASNPLAESTATPSDKTPTPDAKDAQPPIAPPVAKKEADDAAASSRDDDVPGASTRHGWRWSIGAGVGVTGGVAPALAISVPAFVDVARWTRGPLAPSFRLRFERASIGGDAGGANFTWTTGSFDACPVAALSNASFRVWPCARVEAGALEATGDASPSHASTRPWVSAAALVRARWVIVGGLFVEIEAGGYTPIVRDRFYLEPNETVHRAPPFSLAGGANVGASFW